MFTKFFYNFARRFFTILLFNLGRIFNEFFCFTFSDHFQSPSNVNFHCERSLSIHNKIFFSYQLFHNVKHFYFSSFILNSIFEIKLKTPMETLAISFCKCCEPYEDAFPAHPSVRSFSSRTVNDEEKYFFKLLIKIKNLTSHENVSSDFS